MNINPITAIRNAAAARRARGRKFDNSGGDIFSAIRIGNPLGPWTSAFSGFEPRRIDPALYEAMREALPVLDGAIGALVTLDGILRVQGDNDKIVAEIEDWMTNVPVNDAEKGLQALYESQGNERYEQGFGVAEWVADKKKTDIVGIRVADSKGVYFRRDASGMQAFYCPPGTTQNLSGMENIERLLRNGLCTQTVTCDLLLGWGYKQLDTACLLYTANAPEADNPYGTSVLRSLEFGGKSLLVIQNALQQAWTRYGDPPMLVVYQVANKKAADSATEMQKRRDEIAKNIRTAMTEKGKGNSVDVVQAIGKDDTFKIEILGASGSVMEIEQPARHLLEQIVAKVGLPAWMLGLQFSTSERLAEQQSGMALQGAKTRFERRKPDLTNLVATMLRLRGRTWKRGDWQIVQELPNIQDQLKAAQAGFLQAQTAMMLRGTPAEGAANRGVDNNLRASRGPGHKHARKAPTEDDDAEPVGEDWAEDDPELPRIEADAGKSVRKLWAVLAAATIAALRLQQGGSDTDSEGWQFEFDMLPGMFAAGDVFVAGTGDAVGEAIVAAWQRGLANAAEDLPGVTPMAFIDIVAAQLRARGLTQVRGTYGRVYREEIVNRLVGGLYDGMSAQVIARQLQREFDDRLYDWNLLVASEMASAHGEAKDQQYAANGITQYDWTTANDGHVCPICSGYRDHGPYPVGAGPLPMRDSHPLCRCSTVPVLPEIPT